MRKLSAELEAKARHAADLREHDGYRLFRRDKTFVRLVRDFARNAGQFNTRLAGYREQPWPVDNDIRALQRSAQEIQGRGRSSRYADEQIAGDWNDIVNVLDRMVRVSQAGEGRIDFGGYPGPDTGPPPPIKERDPRDRPPPPLDSGRDEYGQRRNPPASGDSGALAGRVRDLEQRAARAEDLAARRHDVNQPRQLQFFEAIHSFHEKVAAFRERLDSGRYDPAQVRTDADRLLEDARRLDNDMRRSMRFPRCGRSGRASCAPRKRSSTSSAGRVKASLRAARPGRSGMTVGHPALRAEAEPEECVDREWVASIHGIEAGREAVEGDVAS